MGKGGHIGWRQDTREKGKSRSEEGEGMAQAARRTGGPYGAQDTKASVYPRALVGCWERRLKGEGSQCIHSGEGRTAWRGEIQKGIATDGGV